MNAREERGLIIAATSRLHRNDDGTWKVPSQSNKEIAYYTVNLVNKTCTCPDCQEGGFVCKHYFAASIVHKRDVLPDGTIVETKSMMLTQKTTYKQVWPKYNMAQQTEKKRFQVLLHDLCCGVQEPVRPLKRGPKPHTFRDSIFAMAFKIYCGFSARRFACDLQDAHAAGFTSKPIPGMKVTAFLENPEFTPILKELIAKSAAPLAAVETSFAVDSSGFSSSRFERWFDHKYGVTRQRCLCVKAHVACGIKTNVITAVRILDKDAADSPQFKPLVKTTAETFPIDEVSADKAYASEENFKTVADAGGTGFIAFKSNHTGGIGGLFEKMFHFFQFKQDEFMAHYHKRSNVESTFSAVKRKFGDSVRSKTDVAMVNEVLCKLLCHNLTCLIMEQEVLGIEPIFWKDEACNELTPPATQSTIES